MTPAQGKKRGGRTPLHHDGSGTSQDRKRDNDEARHHPATHTTPHQAHKPRVHPPGSKPKHHPHTQPAEQALNIDHGTHDDRPRPGKIAKKSKRP